MIVDIKQLKLKLKRERNRQNETDRNKQRKGEDITNPYNYAQNISFANTFYVKATAHGKCKQLKCLHLQAYKQINMNELIPLE